MPIPVSLTSIKHPVVRIPARRDLDPRWTLGILRRIVDEIVDDNLERRAIGGHQELGVDANANFVWLQLMPAANRFGALFGELRQWHVAEVEHARSRIGQTVRLEYVVDERAQAVDVLEHHVSQLFPRIVFEPLAPQRLEAELQRRERALELVRHRVDERVLLAYFDDSASQGDDEQAPARR